MKVQCLDCERLREEKAQGFCGSCYNRRWANGSLPIRGGIWGNVAEYADRFHNRHMKKSIVTEAGCWEYQGLKTAKGYGISNYRCKGMFLHRASFEIFCEPILPGNIVRHKCDNPPCWNPAHLVQGSYSDNSQDAIDRGRSHVGEEVYNAKLTNAQALDIRERALAGVSHTLLAKEYGIARPNVGRIARKEIWKHV